MNRRLPQETKEEFIKLVEEGKDCKYIIEKLHISKSTYYSWKKNLIINKPSHCLDLQFEPHKCDSIHPNFKDITKNLPNANALISKLDLPITNITNYILDEFKSLNEILEPILEDIEGIKETAKSIETSEVNPESMATLQKQVKAIEDKAVTIKGIKEKVDAIKEIEECNFRAIRQGLTTNNLTKMRFIEGKTAEINPVTGTATIKKGNFTLEIPNYANLVGLRTSTYQLLDAITVALTITGAKSPTVIIPLDQYMKCRGLKNRKEAKNQVKTDMEILRQASIKGEEKRGKDTHSYGFINIADSGEIKRNGDIVFTFGNSFYNKLLSYPIMPYPSQLQKINNKKNPNSYYLLRKISEHKNMNIGKNNEDIISVKALLSDAPYIPSYEKVMKTGRQLNQRIIEPFERDMDALSETLCWNYCHSNKQPLTNEELSSISYDLFTSLLIKTEWKEYPDQSVRLERKQEETKANKKRKRSRNKKAADSK